MRVRQGLAFIGIFGIGVWMTLGATPAPAQTYGQRPPVGTGQNQMGPDDAQDDSSQDDQQSQAPPVARPPNARPPGPMQTGPMRQGGGGGRFDALRTRMFELRTACQAGDRRSCIQFGIIIGENRERRGEWRRQNPDLFWWER